MRWIKCMAAPLLASLLLGGCAEQSGARLDTVDGGKPLICASFYTMADFAGKIAGDRAEVVNLVPSGAEPHDWEPSTQNLSTLEKADLLVVNGAGFEHWVEGVVPTLQNDLTVVDTTFTVELYEAHDDHEENHDETHTHNHDTDPHVWLDPLSAKAQMEAIHAALVEIDPDGKPEYDANLARWSEECDKLDAEYRAALDPLPGREIVVAHEAFAYLCGRYGLTQVAAQGLAPEGEPDPARMADVIAYAKEHAVNVIFFESAASPKVAEAIAREIGAETAVLSPLENLTDDQLASGGDYFSVMRENLEQLKVALR